MATSDEILTGSEAAALLNVTDETLRRWAEERRIKHIVLPSGQRRYLRSDIEAILVPIEVEPKAVGQ